MKREIKESTTFDNILSFIWVAFVLTGTCYLVFWQGISAWWFVLAVALMHVDIYHKKETIED